MVEMDQYQEMYNNFRWEVPEKLNISELCCHRWANDASRVAMYYEDASGQTAQLTYAKLQECSNRLSNLLTRLGVGQGSCVAVALSQRPETAIAHMACYQKGIIVMPLSVLFGPEALEHRILDSEAVLAIVDSAGKDKIAGLRNRCPCLRHVISIDYKSADSYDWHTALAGELSVFQPVVTASSDPAILLYTSGTTGAPKGALIPHSAIIGNIPGFVASQNSFPQEGDVFWSPADWAWTGGLWDALLPTLYFGKPIVGYQGRFSAALAFYLLEKYQVTNTFLFPTALKIMMKEYPAPKEKFDLKLRAIMSAGEKMGDTIYHWASTALDITINEMYGQTEINYIVGNSFENWPVKAGSMGRPYPGHKVAVLDEKGNRLEAGKMGEIAVNRYDIHGDRDPVFFECYWKNKVATRSKFIGDWCLTGDLAEMDHEGYLWYKGRVDDVFNVAGYRIGPAEIENCLMKHPAVANVAVIPKPDEERGNIIKAFIVLVSDFDRNTASEQRLIVELQNYVREKLAPYEYPKEVAFINELPMTTTGKIQRGRLRLMDEAAGTPPINLFKG